MSRSSQRANLETEDYLVLGAVLMLPWAFAGTPIGASRLAAFALALAAGLAFWKRGRAGWGLDRSHAGWLLPAFLLAAWGAAQIVPLPPSVLEIASPGAYRIYASAIPGYPGAPPEDLLGSLEAHALARVPEAEGMLLPEENEVLYLSEPVLVTSSWRSISVEPSVTRELVFWYVALLLGFLVARERVSRRDVRHIYQAALMTAFASLAAFALFQELTWNGKIYWLFPVDGEARPFGPYVNRTQFGTLMELAVPWIVGHALSLQWLSWRNRSTPRNLVVGAAGMTCIAAVVASRSKLAVVLIVLSLTLLAWLAFEGRRRWQVMGGVAAIWSGGAVLLAVTPLGNRFRTFIARSEGWTLDDSRVEAWRASLEVLGEFPWAGSGFGTFGRVFHAYLPRGEHLRWSHAHNDYLQFAIEGGLLAVILLAWLLWGYSRRLVQEVRGRPRNPERIGLAIGLGAIGVHAMADFHLQSPATALLLVLLAALAVPWRRREDSP